MVVMAAAASVAIFVMMTASARVVATIMVVASATATMGWLELFGSGVADGDDLAGEAHVFAC